MPAGLIGARFNVYTKAEYLQGMIPAPGTLSSNISQAGGAREYVAVKFTASATHINGSALVIDADGVATLGTVPTTTVLGGRIGILAVSPPVAAVASATGTQTIVGTAFAWAQIYGKGIARAGAAVPNLHTNLNLGADGVLVASVVGGSASGAVTGITAAGTTAGVALIPVLLQYPRFLAAPT
ncbi:MAG: hypothetical protein EHM35_01475 [Planctomycetaceae bacterium]|nr:MAG: hypothetical protein EHM35_01475 [Planctomycetaceae bacterium]